ncbi:MAG: hypothetical protein AAB635_01860 [Patescibacteria group bacterium]
MWLLYIFIVSTGGVLLLLFVKTGEIKNGRQSFVGRLLSKGDPVILTTGKRFHGFLHHHSERAFFLFLVHIPNHAELFFRRLRAKTHKYYHGANTKIRGKRDFGDSAVSPYMRSMSFRRDGDNR